MHIAVVIVGFRNAGDILECVSALERSTYRDFEVVICENGGDEAYRQLSALLSGKRPGGRDVRCLNAEGNVGYAGGVNICLRETTYADAWWILNPDTEPHVDALAALVHRLVQGDCDAVGGTIYLPNGRIQSYGGRWRAWFGRAVSLGFGRVDGAVARATVEKELNFLSGASMLVSARFVREAGLMREDYFLYCEEVEWCIRAARRGLRLGFAPNAQVVHKAGGATGSHAEIKMRPKLPIYLDERNKLLLTRDHFLRRLPIVALSSFFLIFMRFGRRGAYRQLRFALDGWLAGLRNERGRPSWISF